jgi:hypothetical protein
MTCDEPLKLDSLQRDVLAPELKAFLDAAPENASREGYVALADAIRKMEVPSELTPQLGALVEVVLQSGRIRRLFGPGPELALSALFQKTPRGMEIAASLDAINAALEKLAGQRLVSISASLRRPGAYALVLRTGECQMVIRFEEAGVRVESLEVDLA